MAGAPRPLPPLAGYLWSQLLSQPCEGGPQGGWAEMPRLSAEGLPAPVPRPEVGACWRALRLLVCPAWPGPPRALVSPALVPERGAVGLVQGRAAERRPLQGGPEFGSGACPGPPRLSSESPGKLLDPSGHWQHHLCEDAVSCRTARSQRCARYVPTWVSARARRPWPGGAVCGGGCCPWGRGSGPRRQADPLPAHPPSRLSESPVH